MMGMGPPPGMMGNGGPDQEMMQQMQAQMQGMPNGMGQQANSQMES